MITFQEAAGTVPPGRRIYAIGDVHGLSQRLVALHAATGEAPPRDIGAMAQVCLACCFCGALCV